MPTQSVGTRERVFTSPQRQQDPCLRCGLVGCYLLLTCWCLALFFYGLNAGELVRTEGLRAMVAREMLRSGNWIVPTLYGEPLFTKPPGMYVAIVLCSWPLGDVTPWSARLPSAIAATLTVWMFFAFFRRHLGLWAGLTAALILPCSMMWLDKVPAAEIDMVHVAWTSAAILSFLHALEEEENGRAARRWWLCSALAMTAGFLTKWTAPLFLYAAAVPLLWQRGRLRLLLSRHHLLGLILAAALALGWVGWAVSLTSWRIFVETVLREGLPRLVPHYDRPYRYGEALLHPFRLLLTTLPWSLPALWMLWPIFHEPAARARDRDELQRRRFLAAAFHAWTWPSMLIWSYVGEHTPRHSFPLFPGLAGLAVLAFLDALAGRPRLQRTLLIGCVATWIMIKIVFVEVVLPARALERRCRDAGQALARLVPAQATLHVYQLQEETMLFYSGLTVRRLHAPSDLPSPAFVMVSQDDCRNLQQPFRVRGRVESQGESLVVVELAGRAGYD